MSRRSHRRPERRRAVERVRHTLRPPTAASGRSTGSRQSRESTHGRTRSSRRSTGSRRPRSRRRRRLWVIDRGDRSAARPKGCNRRIDPRSNRVTRRIRLAAGTLNDLAVAAGAVWVTDPFAGVLWRIDPGPPTLTKTIAVSPGSALVDANAQAVWVVNHLDDKVYEIDPHTTRSFASRRSVRRRTSPPSIRAPRGSRRPCRSRRAARSSTESACPISRSFRISQLGPNRASTAPMAAAISLVLRERHFRAGSHSVGYRSCDDSTAQSGGFDFETCVTNAKQVREPRDRRRDRCLRHFLQRDRDFGHEPRARPGGDDQPVEHIPRPDARRRRHATRRDALPVPNRSSQFRPDHRRRPPAGRCRSAIREAARG